MFDKVMESYPDVSYEQMRSHVRRHSPKIVKADQKQDDPRSIDELIETMVRLQECQQKVEKKQTSARMSIDDDKPICIAWWSDWHFGANGVNYPKWERDAKLIAETEGLYWFGGGDYKDNYLPKMPFGNNEQLIPPGIQDAMVLRKLEQVKDNNLVLVRGCHDDWDHQNTDKDFVQSMCNITYAYNLWHGGDVHIALGDYEYHFKLRHKYKFESSLNVANSMRRIMELQGPCDVACVAHLHNPYIELRHLMGDFRVMMRSGSYKEIDEHGQKIAGLKGKAGVPCVILFPDKKRMVPMFLKEAVETLNLLRK